MNRKNKRKLLITLNWIAFIILIISVCFLNSRNIIPMFTCAGSFGWLVLSGLANGLCD